MGENSREQVRSQMLIRISWQCDRAPESRDKGRPGSALISQQEPRIFQGKFQR